ncbi:histidine kinase [Adhaeribacter radiodurans]|uniref:histidine kinase n=2 Tax=Adhaeribacter radiodurans TaxID=2745197 RepID=A0A7L7L690_9BACT|nr:sensor histidine kinase [Adhaeribacter radiodurans]QMU28328.1 histidine kinase [Adhaeribacter radiodurans]
MLQDKKGYLWFGSYMGLDKYDGYSVKTYKMDPFDPTSLIHNFVSALYEDKDGLIWIGTAESGISRFDPTTEKFTNFQPTQLKNSFVPEFRSVSVINSDNEELLWIANWGGELRRFNKKTGKFLASYEIEPPSIKGNNSSSDFAILSSFKDKSGTLWFGGKTGLHQLILTPEKNGAPNKVSFKHFHHDSFNPSSLSHNYVTSIYQDHTGVLWIGTDGGGLNRMDPKTGAFTHLQHDPQNSFSLSNNFIGLSSIAEDLAGNLWVATQNGLNRFDRKQSRFTHYYHDTTDPSSLSTNLLSYLFLDRSGILWIGSNSSGINKLDPHQKPFKLLRINQYLPNSLSNNLVTSICEDKEGVLWIGTQKDGLNAFDNKTGKFTQYRHDPNNPQSISSNNVQPLLVDQSGILWIASSGMLSQFNPKTGKSNPIIKGLDYVITLYEDPHGIIWIGTKNGIKGFDPVTRKIIHHYGHDPKNSQGLSDYEVYTILKDKKGDLWAGHGSVGVSRLDAKTGKFKHYLPNRLDTTSLSSSIVFSIYEDSRGNLWFATLGGGLCKFNFEQENFTTYTEKHGLGNNTVFSILEDEGGNLWLGTGKGLSRFSPTQKTFINYDYSDGLQGNVFSIGAAFKGKDGTLYFGGTNGLSYFQPSSIKPNNYLPPIVISQIKVFNKPLVGKLPKRDIELKYRENFFSFEYAALNYTNSQKNQYAYKLEGVNSDWVYSGSQRFASYTNIDPGTYIFRVKGSNNDGVWNEKGTFIRIIIHPPWWRTRLAYGFYFLCFLVGMFALDRFQRRRIVQRERNKARKRELEQAHEIERAYHELKQTQQQLIQKEKMASLGELTAGIAHEIQNPLNFVNNFSEVSTELVEELKEGPFLNLPFSEKKEAEVILNDLEQNLEKIQHHGKRADSIVKSMLQHSRASSGEKQLTDINAIAEEYLRLSYQGVRAKYKDFNASLITELYSTIGKVEVVPQDLGRVLLNVYNNAFYATQQKKTQLNGQYQPEVKVSTCNHDGKVEIRVRDNGTGIPENFKHKIFQPFFTTKPTGQGTGLGLSLSYDIITNVHNGELKVETELGAFTEFIIILPLATKTIIG